ncbi:PREDICTED: calcium-dependent protein kinase 11-like [Camelina sativa]|uniref:Calcium-dependent protein kinase 11-like n=1 Tax=Camelina sativa TaxID=90675 RepID=A0ABM0UTP1_CAMSA|nr:PREDICTED: calcium-dependent protein kinase 11-like [Camelina sativa]
MGMDIADIKENTSPLFCNCFKVASLTDEETILNPPVNVSNLKDRYALGEQLGCGQFGVVRVCSDKLTGERLACKSISKDSLVTQDDMNSLKLEISIMAKLAGRHPNVVNLIAVYEGEDSVHLVMELCAGGELFDRLEKYGRYSEFRARLLFKQLMQVVKFCHDSGVVHRDLKPENILMATMSSSSPIKLADFGLATFIKPGEKLGGTVGSPFYVAPEVLSGGYYNQAADVWSAGVILYILLSGVPPFWGETDSKIFDAVSTADLSFSEEPWDHITSYAKDLIRGMLCLDPSQRLTADDVLAHSWWMEQLSESGYDDQDGFGCEGLENGGGCSFSTQCVSREQDYSFSMAQSEQSSFSSFLPAADNNTLPNSGFGGFSFDGKQPESTSAAFSSTEIPSMPSSFFSPGPANSDITETDGKLRDSSPKRSLPSPDSSSQLERREEAGENQTEADCRSSARAKRRKITVISKILYVHI